MTKESEKSEAEVGISSSSSEKSPRKHSRGPERHLEPRSGRTQSLSAEVGGSSGLRSYSSCEYVSWKDYTLMLSSCSNSRQKRQEKEKGQDAKERGAIKGIPAET